MPAGVAWTGYHYDGRTANREPVTVTITAGGLHLARADGQTALWPYNELRRTGGVPRSQLKLERMGDPPEAIVFNGTGLLAAIRDASPDDALRQVPHEVPSAATSSDVHLGQGEAGPRRPHPHVATRRDHRTRVAELVGDAEQCCMGSQLNVVVGQAGVGRSTGTAQGKGTRPEIGIAVFAPCKPVGPQHGLDAGTDRPARLRGGIGDDRGEQE